MVDINQLIQFKLKKDILSSLNEEYQSFKDKIGKEDFDDLINDITNKELDDYTFPFEINKTRESIKDENICCARTMGKRYTEKRCSYKCRKNTDYCNMHHNMIDKRGFLLFRRYDQERPSINENGNKIPWRDNSFKDEMKIIIDYQNIMLYKNILNSSRCLKD